MTRFCWSLLLPLAACATGGPAQNGTARAPERLHQQRSGNEKVTVYEKKEGLRIWSYTVPEKDAAGNALERLVRTEADLDGDGHADMVTWFDATGLRAKETLDLDYDGNVDESVYYERGQLVRKERDLDGNGKVDTWKYYERQKLVRVERATKASGKVDYWEYWENGQIDRIGEDLDGDGQVDRWSNGPEAATAAKR